MGKCVRETRQTGGGEGGMLEGQATPMGDAPSRSPLWGSAASNRTTGPISLWPKEADQSSTLKRPSLSPAPDIKLPIL